MYVHTSVEAKMFFQSPLFCETAIAMRTLKRTFSFMPAHMTLPSVFVQKAFRAKFTFPRTFASVPFNVKFELRGSSKFPSAVIATVRLFSRVYSHVFLQITILRKTFVTYLARIWLMTCVPPKYKIIHLFICR